MSHFKSSEQEQPGFEVHCWLHPLDVLEHKKHCKSPETLANVPAAQQAHSTWPTKALALPRPHKAHVVLPRIEYWPAGQSVSESIALESLLAAQGMRYTHTLGKAHSRPLLTKQATRKYMKINMATRTFSACKDRDSITRQRCGCKITSSCAESCDAPGSRTYVEDVHSVGADVARCAKHEICTNDQRSTLRQLKHTIPSMKRQQQIKIQK